MFDLLTEGLVRVHLADGESRELSLPATFEALAADRVESFPALRPHQRHPWHALLCQLGAVACLRAGLDRPPEDAGEWTAILRALTAEFPDDEPWRLVSPADKPAFLQPPVGPIEALKPLQTPDELDMLATAKNHDLKGARIADAAPDDWLFALVALQTSQGYSGKFHYEISRMNSGDGNRPGVGLVPPGGIGAHVVRDIRRLIEDFDRLLDSYQEYDADGPSLLWLKSWDGRASMPRKGLHPYYVESCRRVRFVKDGKGRLSARTGNSQAPRIFMLKKNGDKPGEGGITGDPWTPIVSDERGRRALTIDARGFDYRRLSDILFGAGVEPAPLQSFGEGESGDGWTLLCRALARGQGKTEGYHERRVPIPAAAQRRMKAGELPALAALAKSRIGEAGAVRSALRFGLMTLFQNGPEPGKYDPRDPSSSRRAEPFLDLYQRAVDDDFFEALFHEVEATTADDRRERRIEWLDALRRRGGAVLREAQTGAPVSTVRRHRATVRAEDAFRRGFYGSKDLSPYFRKVADAA